MSSHKFFETWLMLTPKIRTLRQNEIVLLPLDVRYRSVQFICFSKCHPVKKLKLWSMLLLLLVYACRTWWWWCMVYVISLWHDIYQLQLSYRAYLITDKSQLVDTKVNKHKLFATHAPNQPHSNLSLSYCQQKQLNSMHQKFITGTGLFHSKFQDLTYFTVSQVIS